MEPVGLALGVIGLAGIFKSCVELFGYFSTYRSYGHDYHLLDAKLHIEKAVLLQWADRMRLPHEDYDRRLDNPTIREAVSQVLSSIIRLLSETPSLQQRYGLKQAEASPPYPLIPQRQTIGGSLMEKFMEDYNAMQARIHQRKATTSISSKLKWVITDKDKFNDLIKDLSYFTSKLDVLVPGQSPEGGISLLASTIRHEIAFTYKEHAKALLQEASDDRLERNAILQEARDQDRALKSLWFRCMGDRKDSVEPAHVKTLQWALKPACEREGMKAEWDDLSEWLRSGTGLYWICGKAGSGKSTLMKYLVDNPSTRTPLNEWAGDLPLTVGSFFFWGLGTQEQKSLEGLSRAILYQLLEVESSYLPSALPRLWQEVRTNVHEKPEPPSSGELKAASEFMIKNFQPKRRFCLFIDGLDEFEGNFHDAIKFIKGLCSNSAIKIIVASRPIAICYDAFSRAPQLHMEHLTRNDVTEYIQDIVGSHPYMEVLRDSGEQSPNTITDRIIGKASGVFLWVILACHSVLDGFAAHDTVEELCRRVDDLPPELEGLFMHMLNSVDRRYHEQMAKTLKIIHLASSNDDGMPTIELACFDRNGMDCTSNVPLESFPIHEARKICSVMVARLRSRCGGLIQAEPRRHLGRTTTYSGIFVCWCSLGAKCPRASASRLQSTPLTNKCEDFPEHSRVVFLHRAVVEFLNNPDVWNLAPLRISDPTFSAVSVIVGMDLQLEYLYCKNGARSRLSQSLLLMDGCEPLDCEPLECVVPVLAKVADYLTLKITQGGYETNETLQPSFSPILDTAYDRSSPQLSLLIAVELSLTNTVSRLLSIVGPQPLGPPYIPFPLLWHSLAAPVLLAINGRVFNEWGSSQHRRKVSRYLLSQGFHPNEVFVNERGLSTTPWRELMLKQKELWEEMARRQILFSRTLNVMDVAGPLIEYGAELDNVLPGISTIEEFFGDDFPRIFAEITTINDYRQKRNRIETKIRLYEKEIMAAIAERRRLMAAEALASSSATSEHVNKETETELDSSNLDTQADKTVDGDSSKADTTGNNAKPDVGRKVNFKAAPEILWWVLLLVIVAISMYMKLGFPNQNGMIGIDG
ncbi:prion-inhibition and propagation-domain-containing protein [Copromyces sp. CBS 386.78]|nr:prion-inhibition and propagation-domain-containing protein [Copromyces sp. CBS 386.78]